MGGKVPSAEEKDELGTAEDQVGECAEIPSPSFFGGWLTSLMTGV